MSASGAEFLHIHNSVLLVVGREIQTGMGVELLEFDLGFEAILSFHHHVYQFVVIFMPFFDAAEVSESTLVDNDERHNIVAQAFLKQNQYAHSTVVALEAGVEIYDIIMFNLRLRVTTCYPS